MVVTATVVLAERSVRASISAIFRVSSVMALRALGIVVPGVSGYTVNGDFRLTGALAPRADGIAYQSGFHIEGANAAAAMGYQKFLGFPN